MDRTHTLIPIQLEDGVEIMIMSINSEIEGFQEVASMKNTLDDAMSSINSLSKKIKKAIDDVSPDEVTVEFSIGFEIKPSKLVAVLVDGSADTSIKIQLKWKK